MKHFTKDELRTAVRERYGATARGQGSDCGCSSSCCSPSASSRQTSQALGYTAEEMEAAPEGSNLGLGCGNPQAIASLRPGETVLDLGSGGGFDCFLAARAVGPQGKVIGVDMTADMVALSRRNAGKSGRTTVEFRLGEIEHLPVADSSVDVIISNCVINLSPEKPQVFREAFRVLKSGGRLAISDTVASAPIPEELKDDLASYSACVTGSASVDELHGMLRDAGFANIRIRPREESKQFIKEWSPDQGLENFILSASIEAVKP
ncbi:MAG TPA: arsenite methyltransferase [Spirochaetia bacterium]|nr:arsenite methyltransferase [Spirochaetia bacterium]